MSDANLEILASRAGLAVDWIDANGRPQRVTPDALRAVLKGLGHPADSNAEIDASLLELEHVQNDKQLPPLLTIDSGEGLDLARYFEPDTQCRVSLESGETLELRLDGDAILPGVIAWKFMLQKDNGALNHLIFDNLGLPGDKPFWLIGDNAFAAVVIVAIWRLWPFAFLMLMAGLQSVPADVYEAASVDGAKPLRQWWNITLPMLRPVNMSLVLVMFLWTFNDFNTPFVLFGGSQPPAGDLISFLCI